MGGRTNVCFIYSVLLLIASLKVRLCIASDSIFPGQSLSGNQTLISKGGLFELGFFTPGNNSHNHYIGIWYKRGSTERKRVVWVANRDSPLSEPSSSELKLVEDGNLVLFNQLQNSVWMTNFTSNTLNSSLVVLGDDGNLIIRNRRDPFNVSWQSFDYPTDTWLPGQKFGVNQVSGLSHILTSWKSLDDPSPGNYSLELDKNGRAQYLIMWNGRQYWISGEWNGQVFSSVPEMSLGRGLYNLSYVANEMERYFFYNLLEDSISMKFTLDLSGQLRLSGWMDNDPSWGFLWAQPRGQCNVYNFCGAFSRCNQNDSSSCGCLPGFQLLRDWIENNYKCSRKIQLQCGNRTVNGETDKFLKIPQTKFPVDQRSSFVNTQGCESSCLQNCLCTAYAYNSGQCSIWNGELLNVQPLSPGDIGGGDLYLKVAASEMDSYEGNTSRHSDNKHERQLSLIIALPIALTVLASSFLVFWLWRRKLPQKGERQRSQDLLLFDIAIHSGTRDTTESSKGEKEDADLPLFSFASVCAATSNFSNANKLGQGGFGIVYKGKLIKGQEVAVKRLSMGSGQGLEELRNETLLIAKLQHRNLVQLLGCCLEGEEKILVYEYMPNNSLDSFIFDPIKRNELDWGKRVHIIEGIAQGLLYLHQYSRVRIIHRDMKPSNILLDSDMNPKISDFGMARIFGGNNSQANTNRIVGTYGYMPPEYAMEGLFSVKSDVFSFGVLVLEIVSGKKNTGFYLAECHNLLDHAWNLWKNNKGLELLDPVLGELSSFSTPLRYIHVALLCVQGNPVDRPTMSGVITMLNNESMILPSPKDPAFVTGRSAVDGNSSMTVPLNQSVNGVTHSIMYGR